MDVTTFTTLVGNLGISGAMCFVMTYILLKEQQSHKDEMSEMRNAIDKVTEAVNNNTSLIQRLIEKLEVKE